MKQTEYRYVRYTEINWPLFNSLIITRDYNLSNIIWNHSTYSNFITYKKTKSFKKLKLNLKYYSTALLNLFQINNNYKDKNSLLDLIFSNNKNTICTADESIVSCDTLYLEIDFIYESIKTNGSENGVLIHDYNSANYSVLTNHSGILFRNVYMIYF